MSSCIQKLFMELSQQSQQVNSAAYPMYDTGRVCLIYQMGGPTLDLTIQHAQNSRTIGPSSRCSYYTFEIFISKIYFTMYTRRWEQHMQKCNVSASGMFGC